MMGGALDSTGLMPATAISLNDDQSFLLAKSINTTSLPTVNRQATSAITRGNAIKTPPRAPVIVTVLLPAFVTDIETVPEIAPPVLVIISGINTTATTMPEMKLMTNQGITCTKRIVFKDAR